MSTSGMIVFVVARLDEDDLVAREATPGPWTTERPMLTDVVTSQLLGRIADCSVGTDYRPQSLEDSRHIARHHPDRVQRDVAGKRLILAEVTSWRHDYVDGDTWFSCAQAVDPDDPEAEPGSGCSNELRAGGPCDCGLDRRRETFLHALAAGYTDHPDYQEAVNS